jgi:magnesium-transporting ATPase (P-type)
MNNIKKQASVDNGKYNPGRDIYSLQHSSAISSIQVIFSLIIYIIIFVIIVPFFIIKNNGYDLLEAYLPNVDLIANLISFHGGLFPGNFFIELYNPSPLTFEGFLSQTIINYLALLGVTFIIARETKLSNSISKGWSLGFVMLFVTYLFPSQIISSFMNYLYDKFEPLSHLIIKNNDYYRKLIIYLPVALIGLLITIGIILFERKIIQLSRKNLSKIAKSIINIPTLIT